MRQLGVAISTIGWMVMLLIVSTDDFYTIELKEYHAMNWKAFLIALAISIGGFVLYKIGELWEEGRQ